MMRKKGKVETVRQKGGDCLESVRQRVRVVKEDPCKSVEIVEYTDPAEMERLSEEERRIAAEARGQEAGKKVLQQHWIEDKLAREEKERRESVRLMEMLRTARIISQSQPKQDAACCDHDVDQDVTDNNNDLHHEHINQKNDNEPFSGKSKQVRKKVLIESKSLNQDIVRNHPGNVEDTRPKPRVVISSKPRNNKENENSRENRNRVKSAVPLEHPIIRDVPLSTRSGLSTIAEVTENITLSERLDRLDLSEDDTMRSMSPFAQSEVTTARSDRLDLEMPNLDAVRRLIDRVKLQGEQLPLSKEHFLNVSNRHVGDESKGQASVSNSKYKVNEDFLQKVLDFSSSISVLSSDESSSFRPLALPSGKLKEDPVPNEKLPAAPTTFFQHSVLSPIAKAVKKQSADKDRKNDGEVQTYLRQYIVKLLQMKHEEIAELSVTNTTDSSADKSSFDAILTKQRLHWQSRTQTSSDFSSQSTALSSSSSTLY